MAETRAWRPVVIEGMTSPQQISIEAGITWLQVIPATGQLGETWSIRSDKLSNPADRALLVAARRACDVVVTTAKTASAESYRASKAAPIAVLDRRGDFVVPEIPTDAEPVFTINNLDELAKNHVKCDFILLESGLTYARALGPRLNNILVTVSKTNDSLLALERANELAGLLNNAALVDAKLFELAGNVVVSAALLHR